MLNTIARSLTPPSSSQLINLTLALGSLLLVLSTGTAAKQEKPKKLQFYMFIAVQNNTFLHNPKGQYTAVQSGAPLTPQANAFGTIHTFDNPLTMTPSLTNTKDNVVGRLQGWYGNCGQHLLTLCLAQTFTWDDGTYKGTFSLLGVDIASEVLKYAPVVGGTGDFAFARGIAVQKLFSTTNVNSEIVSWFHYTVKFKFS